MVDKETTLRVYFFRSEAVTEQLVRLALARRPRDKVMRLTTFGSGAESSVESEGSRFCKRLFPRLRCNPGLTLSKLPHL